MRPGLLAHCLPSQWAFCSAIAFLCLLARLSAAQINVTLPVTAPEITYSPPACNGTLSSDTCSSAWRIIPSPLDPANVVVSSMGPTNASAIIVPQLFMTFTGLALYIKTSSLSNATANISLYTTDPSLSVSSLVNTSVGLIQVVDLHPDQATTLAVTFVPSDTPTRLDISSVAISIPANDTAPFPSASQPLSRPLPTFSSSSSSPYATSIVSSHVSATGDIVAEVLGSVLGALLVASGAVGFRCYRKRRRRIQDMITAQFSPPEL